MSTEKVFSTPERNAEHHLREAQAWTEAIPDNGLDLEDVSAALPAIAHALIALALRAKSSPAPDYPDYNALLQNAREIQAIIVANAQEVRDTIERMKEPQPPSEAQNASQERVEGDSDTELPPASSKPAESNLEPPSPIGEAVRNELYRAYRNYPLTHSSEEWALITRLINVHSPMSCEGRPCVIHNPTQHPMRKFPLVFRNDRGIFERTCPHGFGHPDPDQFEYWRQAGMESASIHGCDGCCARNL